MKKRILLIVILLTTGASAFSQDLVTFGIRGGANYANVSGDYLFAFYGYGQYEFPQAKIDKSKSFAPGFNIGIDALHRLTDKMAIQAELFYSREGYSGDWTFKYEGVIKGEFSDQYSFLNLPLFLKYNFTRHFYVMGGPQVSFLISAKHDEKNNYYDHDIADKMNKVSVGLTPAIGYDLNKVSFSLRYFAGLTPLIKAKHDVDFKGQVFSVVVSYKIFSLEE